MSQPADCIGLLRALQRQLARMSVLAAGKAENLPDHTFSHYSKRGEALGLHSAWRVVADLADRIQEGP